MARHTPHRDNHGGILDAVRDDVLINHSVALGFAIVIHGRRIRSRPPLHEAVQVARLIMATKDGIRKRHLSDDRIRNSHMMMQGVYRDAEGMKEHR